MKRFLRDVLGRGNTEIVEALVGQVDAAEGALRLLADELANGSGSAELADRVEELETRGDGQRRRLTSELGRALTTPIDREDLFRVSRSIDDVVDNLRDFARELVLYQPGSTDCFTPLVDAAIDGVEALRAAVTALPGDPEEAQRASRRTKDAGNELRRHYEQQLAELFERELTMDVIKTRELLRRLDVVALRLGEAADALDDGLLKRM